MSENIYCLKCKKQTNNKEMETVITKNNRAMQKTKCLICNTTKCKFAKI